MSSKQKYSCLTSVTVEIACDLVELAIIDFVIPENTLNLNGALTHFEKISDSGNKIGLAFCPNCGSNILAKSNNIQGVVAITAGSLDDPEQYKPTMNIFTESVAF